MGLFDSFKRKKQRMVFSDGVVIEYETMPPNFREKAAPDGIHLVDTCGICKFCGNIRSTKPNCTKYGVQYQGVGCLDKTVCDDFKNELFHWL